MSWSVRCVVSWVSLAVGIAACGSDSGATDTGVDASADAGMTDATVSATLVSLVPSAGALSPSFESETLTYNLSLPPGSVSVAFTPVAEPATATIRVQGEVVASGASSEAIALTAIVTPVTVSVGDRDLCARTPSLSRAAAHT